MQLMCQIDLVMFPRKRKIASCCNTWQSCWFLSGSLLIFFLFSFQFYLLPEGWLFVLVWNLHGMLYGPNITLLCTVIHFLSCIISRKHLRRAFALAYVLFPETRFIASCAFAVVPRYCLVLLVVKGFHEYIRSISYFHS